MSGEVKNFTVVIYPPNEIPYPGRYEHYQNDYWKIIDLAKMEWFDDYKAVRVSFAMQKLNDDSPQIDEHELRKAKKSRLKLL